MTGRVGPWVVVGTFGCLGPASARRKRLSPDPAFENRTGVELVLLVVLVIGSRLPASG
jgi:hypothetical protein